MAARRLRPFPLAISIGTDIVSVSRIQALLARQQTKRFVEKVMTEPERLHFYKRYPEHLTTNPDATQLNSISQHLAGRFAAKEAVIKACTWRRLLLQDVQILPQEVSPGVYGVILDKSQSAPPSISVTAGKDGQVVQVSISHEQDYATAVCIAATEPMEGDVGGEASARSI